MQVLLGLQVEKKTINPVREGGIATSSLKPGVFPHMKPRDWKKEVQMYCPCFSDVDSPLGLIIKSCPNPAPDMTYKKGCPAFQFKKFLMTSEPPSIIDFTLACLRMGTFKRVQIVAAIFELYKGNYKQASYRVETCLRRIKSGKIKGHLIKDDTGRLTWIQKHA